MVAFATDFDFLIALGTCLASLEDTAETSWSIRVVQASKIAPSIWPIVFSGVLGNAMRAYADYRVERGISLLVWRAHVRFFGNRD